MSSSTQQFLLALVVASALLAAWFFVRFPRLAPTGNRGVTLGLLGMFAVFGVTPTAVMVVGEPLGAVAAAFLVVLPACVYIFLACIWLLAYVRRGISPYLR
ncbi:MAG TPA: hypothetical protein VK874_06230 [Gaiellaceae bacterium]|nr:hypothetical protein [Gaiellaceae bacterium]